MSNNSKISNRTSKNILLGLGAALLIASCAQNEGWEQPSDSGKPNTQPITKPVTKPTPQPEPTPTTNQGQFLGLFAADITTDGQNITSSEVRPLSAGAALENIVLSVDNTINLKDDKTGIKHYLTTLNVINKSNKDIATPTFVPVATSRTNNTFFHSAQDKSGQASDPAGIVIEQGHHNSAGNIVVDPQTSKLAAVNFTVSSIVPKAGDKITKVSGKAWQSAALAQNASQKVQFGFMIPKANNTFRFTMLFAVMDGNKLPTADFTYKPTAPTAGQKISFDAKTLSKDIDGKVAKYVFNFGDGSKEVTNTTGLVDYAFAKAGSYKVNVYVVDDKGAKSAVQAKTLVVKEKANIAKVCKGDFLIDDVDTAGDIEKIKNCTEITGDLKISKTKLENLDGLKNLTTVGGYLRVIGNRSLTNLDGLKNLTTVGGYLYVAYNSSLTNLDGLKNITTVGGDLYVAYTSSLTNLDGLKNLTTVGGDLYVAYTSSLTNLDGLKNLTTVGGDLNVTYNNSLTNLDGLKNLTTVGGDLYVAYNSSLTNLDGLKNITTVGGYLRVNGNDNLTNLDGLKNITTVGGYLRVNGNDNLTNLDGLQNITTVGGSLDVGGNDNLTNLDGLSNITTVGGSLGVVFNDSLTNLDGLSNITTVGGSLGVGRNPSLTNIDGLRNIKEVKGSFRNIYNNPKLDCTPYNSNPFAFFPLTSSTGNKVNCTTR